MTTQPKAGYTKGEWQRNIRAGGKYPVVYAGRNQHIATVSQQTDPEETEANIDLISAAPSLVEAAQYAMESLVRQYPGPTLPPQEIINAIDSLEAALKKAGVL